MSPKGSVIGTHDLRDGVHRGETDVEAGKKGSLSRCVYIQEAREMKACAQLVYTFPSPTIRVITPHSGWGFGPQSALSGDALTEIPRGMIFFLLGLLPSPIVCVFNHQEHAQSSPLAWSCPGLSAEILYSGQTSTIHLTKGNTLS